MSLTTNLEQKISALIHAIDVDVDLISTLADQTVQTLAMEKGLLIALNQMTTRTTEMIEGLFPAGSGDALLCDEDIRKSMERAETKLAALIRVNQQKKESAVADSRLRGTDEGGVLSEHDESIGCAQLLAHSLQKLRWAAMEHDADASPISDKEYTDVKKLITDMEV